jgi:hypothetical protein
MTILRQGANLVEVRVKREPEGTYFDEHSKPGQHGIPNSKSCERYIAGEEGIACSIEVTLKKGYSFGNYNKVRANLYTHGRPESVACGEFLKDEKKASVRNEDVKLLLSQTSLSIGGQKLEGATLAFKGLNVGETLLWVLTNLEEFGANVVVDNGALVHGIGSYAVQPKDVGTFVIKVLRITKPRKISKNAYAAKVRERVEEREEFDQTIPINPTAVDEVTYNKDGITSAIEYDIPPCCCTPDLRVANSSIAL